MSIKVSIITINFQNNTGIRQTIESVISQTYNNIEYIIIDGASTDGSIEIINQYADQLSYFVSESDNGIYHAMNKGWKKATGEYCLFLNSGDYLYKNTVIEQVVNKIPETPADIIFGDLYAFDENQYWVTSFKEKISLYYFHHSFIPHPSTFTKRSLLIELNGFYEHYKVISDWAFFVRCFLHKASFQQIDIVTTAFYMQGSSSNSDIGSKDKIALFENEFKYLAGDFENFDRLKHFDTSVLTKIAKAISSYKIKYFG